MMNLHGPWQALGILVGLYTLFLGWSRFKAQHLGKPHAFKYKRHVFLGQAACLMLIAGAIGGLVLARIAWRGWLITGLHGYLGVTLIFILALVFATGKVMANKPKKRKTLPLFHGALGFLAMAACLIQAASGWQVRREFLGGF
jgi:hypothetical protein